MGRAAGPGRKCLCVSGYSRGSLGVLALVVIGMGSLALQNFSILNRSHTYRACLMDAYLQQAIKAENMEVFFRANYQLGHGTWGQKVWCIFFRGHFFN